MKNLCKDSKRVGEILFLFRIGAERLLYAQSRAWQEKQDHEGKKPKRDRNGNPLFINFA